VFDYRTAERHHQGNRCIDLLIRPALGGVQVPTPVRFTDHVADASGKDRVAVVMQPARSHCRAQFDNGRAEILGRRAEFVHRHALILQPLRRLPRICSRRSDPRVSGLST